MKNRKILALILVFAMVFSMFASAATYTVAPGDVLWKIAKENGTTWQKLAEINSLKNPHTLKIGQVLKLDDGAATPTPTPTPVAPSTGAALSFKAGTYTASQKGFGGNLKIEVAVDATKILSVKISDHSETAGIGTNAIEKLPAKIVTAQSLKIDTIAGCTVTSQAILDGVKAALSTSGVDMAVLFAEPKKDETKPVTEKTITTDLLIIGAGAAGASAAISARQNGVENLILIEKMPSIGGATSLAGGGIEAAAVVKDDPAKTLANQEYMFMSWIRGGKYTSNARLTWLGVQISTDTLPWLSDFVGGKFTLTSKEGDPMTKMSSVGGAGATMKIFDQKIKDMGINLMLETKANSLIKENGKIVGAVTTDANGNKLTIRAKATLLATGGYCSNPDLLPPEKLGKVVNYGSVSSTGDGQLMAQAVGAPLFNMDKVATKPYGVETSVGKGIHIHSAINTLFKTTGAIAVSKEGNRIINEIGLEYDIVQASKNLSSDGQMYSVMDAAGYEIFKAGCIKSNYFSEEQLSTLIKENGTGITKFVKNDTLAGAAKAIGVDAAALEASVAKYNAGVKAGKDEFGRAVSKEMGAGPYYILRQTPRFATTLGGMNVDNNLKVLDINEEPIPGLYAAGEVVGNVQGSYATSYLIWCFSSGRLFGTLAPAYIK